LSLSVSAGPVAEAVDDVECGFHLAERRHEPFSQARARFRRGYAAGCAVQQANAEACFEPPHRFA